jgi:putative glycosyltransferase (TIGR04348 family)
MRARQRVVIVTPYGRASNNGNWHTAARWARWLGATHAVEVVQRWTPRHAADVLIALHARRSADSIAAFAQAHPKRRLVVVLTGTDLYRDIATDENAQRSLQLATRLVVLNAVGAQSLSAALRGKSICIPQSAGALSPGRKPARYFDVAVVGHLRDEKNPQLVWSVAAQLPPEARIRLWHAGAARQPGMAAQARRVMRSHAHYRWLGDLPRAAARQLMRRCHVLLHPSRMEGGAQAVIEAVTAHTPVLASRIDGNVGLLGQDYPAYFDDDNADQAAALLLAAASAPRLLARWSRAAEQAARQFDPALEARRVHQLVTGRESPAAPARR